MKYKVLWNEQTHAAFRRLVPEKYTFLFDIFDDIMNPELFVYLVELEYKPLSEIDPETIEYVNQYMYKRLPRVHVLISDNLNLIVVFKYVDTRYVRCSIYYTMLDTEFVLFLEQFTQLNHAENQLRNERAIQARQQSTSSNTSIGMGEILSVMIAATLIYILVYILAG